MGDEILCCCCFPRLPSGLPMFPELSTIGKCQYLGSGDLLHLTFRDPLRSTWDGESSRLWFLAEVVFWTVQGWVLRFSGFILTRLGMLWFISQCSLNSGDQKWQRQGLYNKKLGGGLKQIWIDQWYPLKIFTNLVDGFLYVMTVTEMICLCHLFGGSSYHGI